MMERCAIHGCVLIIRKMAVGWGDESLKVCMMCEEEKTKSGKPIIVISASKPGWQ